MGLLDRAGNLLALLQSRNLGKRPLCFVTHSLGGLLAKQMAFAAVNLSPEYANIADNFKGVVFLATPHTGAAIANLCKSLRLLRPAELVGDLASNDAHLRALNQWYSRWAQSRNIRHRVYFEKQRTRGILVVSAAAADPHVETTPIGIDANHSGICKPADRASIVYLGVGELVRELSSSVDQQGVKRDRPDIDSRIPERQQVGDPRVRVFEGTGWSKTLKSIYSRFPPLVFCGVEFPIWVKPALEGGRENLDTVLARDLLPGDDPRDEIYPESYDPNGRKLFEAKIAAADPLTSYNGATFAFDRIEISPKRAVIHARHGTYFHSLATSECLERELVEQLAEDPDREVELDELPLRQWVHDAAGGQRCVVDGRRRAAALSVSAALIMAEPDGTYSCLMARRSKRVETHGLFAHVAPAGIFAPINAERREDPREYSIRNCLLREYAEELYGYKELEQGEGTLARDVLALPPIRELLEGEENASVFMRYSGFSVPLLNLRPEVCSLILVREEGWLARQIELSNDHDHWFELNWEYGDIKDIDAIKLRLDDNFEPIDRETIKPSLMVPHAAAALSLAIPVAREIVQQWK